MRLSIEPYALPLMIEIEKIQGAAYGMTVTVRHVGSLSEGWLTASTHARRTRTRTHTLDAAVMPSMRQRQANARREPAFAASAGWARENAALMRRESRVHGEAVLRTATRTVCLIGWTAANEWARTSCRSGGETARKSTTASVQGGCPICGDGGILGRRRT
ncbi:hypothetical protein A33K_13236 [Burkholderia humptydooensis MSMB43]|uniref:Uncharacterized protein n=1 Tax=Burkholderia humptydooensis MSMB43 TaxID=441157 RepID=A0ABN0GBC8_9BURK|nr:hypothetical protein A33K_13236 [Burkholderia humptydooensis MSMB43]